MNSSHSYTIRTLAQSEFPEILREIPQKPEKLYLAGKLPDPKIFYYLSVVGSRKYTSYGREAVERIIKGLAGYPVAIVSGLALGIDSIAHREALDAKLPTIAIPGSGLDPSVIYPRTHLSLAREIVGSGGALLSEYEPDLRAAPWTFPQRNRLMAGLSRGTLVIEAEEKSGTLITARLALDYNRDVYVIPGSIFSATSKGTNNLIRQGATPITSAEDLLGELGLGVQEMNIFQLELYTPEEQLILSLLEKPCTRENIFALLPTPPSQTLSTLMVLEIKGVIREHLGKIERVK